MYISATVPPGTQWCVHRVSNGALSGGTGVSVDIGMHIQRIYGISATVPEVRGTKWSLSNALYCHHLTVLLSHFLGAPEPVLVTARDVS